MDVDAAPAPQAAQELIVRSGTSFVCARPLSRSEPTISEVSQTSRQAVQDDLVHRHAGAKPGLACSAPAPLEPSDRPAIT
jgi:hypothetical protein